MHFSTQHGRNMLLSSMDYTVIGVLIGQATSFEETLTYYLDICMLAMIYSLKA